MNLINMNHLYYFSVIAKEKSISKASQILHVTQPALSHQLKQLEEQLECKLFDRVGRGLELNINGQYLLEFTNKITRDTDNIRFLLKEKKQNQFLRLIVGVDVTISNGIIYDFIKQTMLIPDLKIEIIKSDLLSLENMLSTKEIDIVITIKPDLRNFKSIYSLPIDVLNLLCVIPENSFDSNIDIRDHLSNKMLISYCKRSPYREVIDSFLLSQDIKSKSRIEVTCPWIAIDLLYHDLGASFIPENMLLWNKNYEKIRVLKEIDMIPLQVHALIDESSIDQLPYKVIVKSHEKFQKRFHSKSLKGDLNHFI